MAFFAWDRAIPAHALEYGIGVRLKDFQLHRPRQWGACWLACELYGQLGLDGFWAEKLADSREGTCWRHVLQTLVCYRLIAPGSEWRLLRRLKELHAMKLSAKDLLLKLGEARERFRAAWRLLDFELPSLGGKKCTATFSFRLNREKLRNARRREGRYLLRTNLCDQDPAKLWNLYIQLTEIEAAFKNLKNDLDLRPIYHQREDRIEAHIFISFLAYCLHVTLRARLRPHAPGLTPRAVLDKFAAIQMVDAHFPTTDGRTLILSRYTQPEADQKLLLQKLGLQLPEQPPPKITSNGTLLS